MRSIRGEIMIKPPNKKFREAMESIKWDNNLRPPDKVRTIKMSWNYKPKK